MNHIMVDLETLGVGTMPVVLSIGAVRFDPDAADLAAPSLGNCYPTTSVFMGAPAFHVCVDLESCVLNGGTVDRQAINFWAQPEQAEARKHAMPDDGTLKIADALRYFTAWARHENDSPAIWSHGLLFDAAIIQRWCERMGVSWPFGYRDARDTRTLFAEAGYVGGVDDYLHSMPFKPAIAHHPLYDAWWQARAVQESRRALRAPRVIVGADVTDPGHSCDHMGN